MRYFGVFSLNSLDIDLIKSEASNQGVSNEDKCDYDQFYNILLEVFDNSKETIKFEFDQIYRQIVVEKGKIYKFDELFMLF